MRTGTRATTFCAALLVVSVQIQLITARRLQQAQPPLAEQLAVNVESTLAAARSPSLAPNFEAGVKRAEGYARAPVAPEIRATINRAVDKLVGRAPAPGPEQYALAEGIVAASGRGRYDAFVPALPPSGKEIYEALTSVFNLI